MTCIFKWIEIQAITSKEREAKKEKYTTVISHDETFTFHVVTTYIETVFV